MLRRRFVLVVMLLGLLSLNLAAPASVSAEGEIGKAASGKSKPAEMTTPDGITRTLPTFSGGTVVAAQDEFGMDPGDVRADAAPAAGPTVDQVTARTLGCSTRNAADVNVRVNQDCTFRRQAEELIKANPADLNNLIAGQNDSRVGFNHCGFSFSLNGGRTWGDGQPPFFQHLNNPDPKGIHTVAGGPGTNHTYDAASDPALAFDSAGRAFYSCITFDVFTNASAVVVTSSPPGAQGSFYNNVPEFGTAFIAAEDNSALAAHDKEFITADSFGSSPNKDNVYVTWTVFKFSAACVAPGNPGGQCSSAIFGSMSTDHAVTWSRPEEISGTSANLCFFGNFFDKSRDPHACDFDQGSDPTPLPNGNVAVVFRNGNTPSGDPNAQQLAVTCHPAGDSTKGTARLNCGSPAKVGDDVIVGRPRCNFGRGPEECVPGPFIRTNDFPRIAVNRSTGTLFSAWQDFRNGEYDIQLARSTDGGATWMAAPSIVNPDRGKDHYMPAIDVTAAGADDATGVAVSFYRSDQVPNEAAIAAARTTFAPGTGPGTQPGVQAEPSDYSLASGRSLSTPFRLNVISPTFPPPIGNQAGFNGDYSGLVVTGNAAHPIWSDTRNVAPAGQVAATAAPDEDIFTDRVALSGD